MRKLAGGNSDWGRKSLVVVIGVAAFAASLIFGAVVNAPSLRAQTKSGDKPKFEVASVKPCEPGDLPPGSRPDAGRGGGGGNGGLQLSPGRLTVVCRPVRIFIAWAYADYADGQSHTDRFFGDIFSALNGSIEGLPSWGNSKRFTISAEAPGDTGKEMMMGPMMQSLLEDRFSLQIRTETREAPVYELTMAKGGPKLPQPDGAICRTKDLNHVEQGPATLPSCTMQFKGASMANFAALLRGPIGVDRPVIDKTGMKGTFAIHMAYSINLSDDSGLPTIFEALNEQLGLELLSTKVSGKVLVVDHIEEPTPN